MNGPSNPGGILPLSLDGIPLPVDEIPTSDLLDAFIEAKANAWRSPKTLGKNLWVLKPFVKAHPFLPMDPAVIEAYFGSLTHLGNASIVINSVVIGGFYRWLVRRRYIQVQLNPFLFVERPRLIRKLPQFLSAEMVRWVLLVSHPGVERTLISVLIAAGPRIGELDALTKDDVRNGALVLVSGKTGERIIPLPDEVVGYLRSLDTYYLFPARGYGRRRWEFTGKPLTVGGMRDMVRRILRRAGYKGPKKGPHLFRHTFATEFMAGGGSVITLGKILGHTNSRMSERYVSLSLVQVQEEYRRVNVFARVLGMRPLTPVQELPKVSLPEEVRLLPDRIDGLLVLLMFVADRRPNHTFYYIRARVGSSRDLGSKRLPVASLGTDLPLETVDAYRKAVAEENLRRQAGDRVTKS